MANPLKIIARATLIVMALLLTGCGKNPAPATTPAPTPDKVEYIKIAPQEAQDMMAGDAIILDVRTQEEYDEGHIKNAVLIPDYEIAARAEREITDKEQIILVYCRTGKRSASAARQLIAMGYQKVFDFGGIVDWPGEIVWSGDATVFFNYFGGELPPDVITPIYMTVKQKVNERMPEYSFLIIGTSIEEYGFNHDKSKYFLSYTENIISRIDIRDENGLYVQSISGLDTKNPASEAGMYGLKFEDWNFDGYMDIGLWKSRGGTMKNNPHYYWLWDNEKKRFVENEYLKGMSEGGTIKVNYDTKELSCFASAGRWGYGTVYYKFIDGNFLWFRSIYTRPVQNPEDENNEIIMTTKEELIDGEWVIIEEFYGEYEYE